MILGSRIGRQKSLFKMYNKFVSAIAALGMATGAIAVSCSDATATIQTQADATTIASCTTVKGSVLIAPSTPNSIDIGGSLTSIGGDLTCLNNGGIISLSSDSLTSIGGAFELRNVTVMTTLAFTKLSSVGSINWVSLNALGSLTFGTPGVTEADSVIIADTFLNTLEGINIHSLTSMNINNNRRLTDFTTELHNLSDVLNINANGQDLSVSMPNLQWIANMTISNVTEFSAPSLAAVNGSMRFDSNFFTNFSAPNLTEVQTGDVSFVSNGDLQSISMPALEKVGGGFTIANNTELAKLDGFASLEEVGGAVKLRGSFTEVDLPKLNDVKGAFDVSSTEDIESSCETFAKLQPDQGGEIQGEYSCTSKNANANNDTSDAGDGSSSSGSGNSAASAISISTSAVVTLAGLAAVVSAFL